MAREEAGSLLTSLGRLTQAGTMARLVLRILLRFRRFRIWLSTRRGRVDDSTGAFYPCLLAANSAIVGSTSLSKSA